MALVRTVSRFFVTDAGVRRAAAAGRAYWRLLYRDGRVLNEWDGWDWLDVPRRGQQAVRLCCPNGQVATLGNESDASGRLFQLKVALLTLPTGEPDPEQRARRVVEFGRSQVEWSFAPQPRPHRPHRPPATVPARRTVAQVIGMLHGTDGQCQCIAWEYDPSAPGGGHLTPAWEDNVYLFRYQHLGPLRADVLGLRAA